MLWKTPLAVVLLSCVLVLAQSPNSATNAAEGAKSGTSAAAAADSAKSKSNSAKSDSAKPGTSQAGSVKSDSAKHDYSKEAFVIDRLDTHITEESDGTGARERTAEIRVLSDAGVKAFAVLSFSYTSDNESVEFDYVRVRKPDGTVVKTPDYNIQDMPADVSRVAPLYSDVHEKHVAVKGLEAGDTLEYMMHVRVFKAQVPGQFWYEDSFIKDSVVRDERLELSVPADKYVKVVSPEFKPEITQENGRKIYRWTHANLEVKEKDPDEIPRRTVPTPDVQVTTFASWEDVGRWYAGLQKDPLQVTPAIQAKAAELIKGLQTDDEKIHALYNFVSLKYHYIGLDFGIGRYQPHAADDVLGNGYGDCKDKHTLLASLLKAAGYDAWPALINGSRTLDADVPSPAQFNHVITVVPRNGKYIWLDTTPEVAPYGLILLQLRNKQALVMPTNEAPRLMTTPADPPEPQHQEFSMEGKLDSDGVFTGHAEVTYNSDTEVLVRAAFRQTSESQWTDLLQRMSRAMNFGGDVSNVKVTPPDEIDKPFIISYDYVRKDFADWENHHTSAPLPPLGLEVYKDAKDREPPEPWLLGAMGTLIYRSRVTLPKGYELVPPAPVYLKETFADYSGVTRVEDGVMTTTRELKIKKTEVPLSDWETYRTFGIAIAADEFNPMSLTPGTVTVVVKDDAGKEPGKGDAAKGIDKAVSLSPSDLDGLFRDGAMELQQHDVKRARESFEKVLAANPNYKGAHFNLGLTMWADRDIPGAIDQFHKEEEISPSDPRAYEAAARLDTLNGNRDGAIGEWSRLVKADPENRIAASTLGNLLYEQEKYPEAEQAWESALRLAPDDAGLLMQLGNAYLKTGQNEKALASMQKAVGQSKQDPEFLNNVAWALVDNKLQVDLAQKYAEEAIQKVEQQGQAVDASDDAKLRGTFDLALTWDTLGWIYFREGDAKRAEGLVRAAWLLGEDRLVAEHLGEIYEKEGRVKDAAHAYETALAVSSIPSPMTSPFGALQSPGVSNTYQDLTRDIRNHYQKLTGRQPPMTEIRRLPNGQWTQTPAEQLRHTREVKLANPGKLWGSAQFIVEFEPGKVEAAHIVGGEDDLKPLAAELNAAHYPLEFPPASKARLAMRVDVNCHVAECIATLQPATPAPLARNKAQ